MRSYDPLGAISITASLVLAMYAVAGAPVAGWESAQTILLLALAAGLLAAFGTIERRAREPLVPLVFFRSRLLIASNLGFALASAAIYGMAYVLSLYTQEVLHYSAVRFGLAALVMPVGVGIGAQLARVAVTKRGPRVTSALAMLALAGALRPARENARRRPLRARHPAGAGGVRHPGVRHPAFNAYAIATLMGVGEREAGLAAGLNNTSEMMGGALGTALMATIAVEKTGNAIAGGRGTAVALTEGFQAAFTVGIVFALLGAVVSVGFLGVRRQTLLESTAPEAPLAVDLVE